MTEQMVMETKAVVKFSDLKTGDTAWAIIAGKPVNIIKTNWAPWGAMGSNARRAQGRNGKTFVSRDAKVFATEQECTDAFNHKFSTKRLVAIGDETGVTAVDADWLEQADYDQTVQDAAGRRGY